MGEIDDFTRLLQKHFRGGLVVESKPRKQGNPPVVVGWIFTLGDGKSQSVAAAVTFTELYSTRADWPGYAKPMAYRLFRFWAEENFWVE